MLSDILNSRATGEFLISIATSLALEGAFGIHPDHPVPTAPIKKYDAMWINLRTLFRNVIGSIGSNDAGRVTAPMLAEVLNEEMSFIRSIVGEMTDKTVNVVFYYSNYNHVETKFKHSVVRMDNTDKQREFTALHNQTIKLLLENNIHQIKGFDLSLHVAEKDRVNTLLISHYAIDLVSAHGFKKLALLESHTGIIKESALWHTKFYNGNELNQIPFTKMFLTVFGDDTIFRPHVRSLRMDIMEIAKKYNWSSVSTKAKIHYGLEQLRNPYAREILFDML